MKNGVASHIETDRIHFKYAVGEPMVKSEEFHGFHELVLFLSGSSYFISKNIQQSLTPGTLVVIPKEQFHRFCIDTPERYERCILGFYSSSQLEALIGDVMTGVKVIGSPDKRITALFSQLAEIAKSDLTANEKQLFLEATLAPLMIYIKQSAADTVRQNISISPMVRRAMLYIDEHYSEPLTVRDLAGKLYVSSSTLAHKFSKELNISIYRYISKKRLSEALHRISRGEALTAAAAKCGYRDYSCFYRIYQKYGKSLPASQD